jgi:hypothetical protein
MVVAGALIVFFFKISLNASLKGSERFLENRSDPSNRLGWKSCRCGYRPRNMPAAPHPGKGN